MVLEQITNYLEDDWDDDSLSNRDNANEGYFLHPSDSLVTSGDVEAGTALKGVYRPEWTIGVSGPSATSGTVVHDTSTDDGGLIKTTSKFTTGSWKYDFQFTTAGGDADSLRLYIDSDIENSSTDDTDSWFLITVTGTSNYNLVKNDSGTETTSISSSWPDNQVSHTSEMTRTSYGDWELFLDSTSQGTTTDPFMPEINSLQYWWTESLGNSVIEIDNLVIQ